MEKRRQQAFSAWAGKHFDKQTNKQHKPAVEEAHWMLSVLLINAMFYYDIFTADLIFVTNITNFIRGEKIVM